MKLVTYRASVEAGARLGVLVEGMVVDVARLGEAYGEAMLELRARKKLASLLGKDET